MDLKTIGWSDFFQQGFDAYKAEKCRLKEYYATKEFFPARVSAQFKNRYVVLSERGEEDAVIRRVFLHDIDSRSDLPVVGDWVILINADNSPVRMIDGVLPRSSQLGRNSERGDGVFHNSENKNPDQKKYSKLNKGEQILGVNIDIAFIVTSLNLDFNIRRIERYLSMVLDGGASPVILLTKTDLCTKKEIAEKLVAIKTIAVDVPVHCISTVKNKGLEELEQYWSSNKTMVLLGSSGVGKSTLINKIVGYEKMLVQDISDYKDKGQHTTSHKEMIILEQGGIIIDTPGIREIQLSSDEETLKQVFSDISEEIDALSMHCKFRSCRHETEPGCAVQAALQKGELSEDRWNSYNKLLRQIQQSKAKIKSTGVSGSTKERKFNISKEIHKDD